MVVTHSKTEGEVWEGGGGVSRHQPPFEHVYGWRYDDPKFASKVPSSGVPLGAAKKMVHPERFRCIRHKFDRCVQSTVQLCLPPRKHILDTNRHILVGSLSFSCLLASHDALLAYHAFMWALPTSQS